MAESPSYRLMIVDDEDKIRLGLKNLIDWEDMGFQVVCDFSDGRDAIAYLKENLVDVILTDVKMNHVSGLQVAQFVRDQQLPAVIVLLSAYKEFELAQQAVNTQVFHYLLKPIKLDELYRVFARIREKLDTRMELPLPASDRDEDVAALMGYFRQQFLRDLVNGVFRSLDDVKDWVRRTQVKFRADQFMLAVMNITYPESLRDDYDETVCSIADDCGDALGDCVSVLNYIKNTLILFIDLPPAESGIDSQGLHRLAQQITRAVSGPNKPVSRIGFSAVHHGYDQVNSAFREARYALDTLADNQPYHLYEAGAARGLYTLSDIITDSDNIYRYVCEGNVEAVARLTDRIVGDLWDLDESEVRRKNYIVQVFSGIYGKAVENLPDRNSVAVIDYSFLMGEKDSRTIGAHLTECLASLARLYTALNRNAENVVIKKAQDYIRQFFTRDDISLNSIAEAVYMSPSYFSRVFKECTHENVSDYIIRLRIDRARELLRDTDLNINDITAQIGYKSSKYFSKLFHRTVGLTPRAYRSSIRMVSAHADL